MIRNEEQEMEEYLITGSNMIAEYLIRNYGIAQIKVQKRHKGEFHNNQDTQNNKNTNNEN